MEEAIKNRALARETVSETVSIAEENLTPFTDLDKEAQFALHCASEKKANDIVVLDLRDITSFTEFFLSANGTNQRQVQAIADEINQKLRKEMNTKVTRAEGYQSGEWVLLDYGDFIVHIFNTKSRTFYDLERLWRDAKRVDLPEEL